MERLNGCCDVVMKFLAFSQGTQTLFARRKKEKDSFLSLSFVPFDIVEKTAYCAGDIVALLRALLLSAARSVCTRT